MKLNKKDIIILSITIIVFISSILFFVYKKGISNSKPSVYYRTYTKEDGWSKWAKNGEICGNNHYITALQVKVKTRLNGFLYYNIMQEDKYKNKAVTNNEIIGDKKHAMQAIKMKVTDDIAKRYTINYRVTANKKDWNSWGNNYLDKFYITYLKTREPVKYIQIEMKER